MLIVDGCKTNRRRDMHGIIIYILRSVIMVWTRLHVGVWRNHMPMNSIKCDGERGDRILLREEIDKRAEAFVEQYGIRACPVDIVELCNRVGIKVFEEYLPEEVSGYILIREENFEKYGTNKVIVVNLLDGPMRRRFTIAHELAHHVLHNSGASAYFAHRDAGQNSRMENEANAFAANILMPKALVLEELNRLRKTWGGDIPLMMKISQVARTFAVPESAAEVRMNALGVR